jgi:hypothetical protein
MLLEMLIGFQVIATRVRLSQQWINDETAASTKNYVDTCGLKVAFMNCMLLHVTTFRHMQFSPPNL